MGACKNFCVGFSKIILIVFNVVIMISAIVLIARGISVMSSNQPGNLDLKQGGGFVIGVGIITLLIAFAGCWGAFRENPCCLTVYAAILLVLVVVQVIFAIMAFASTSAEQELKMTLKQGLAELYKRLDDQSILREINVIQSTIECCGIDGPGGQEVNNMGLMQSCCPSDVGTCRIQVAYQEGCAQKLTDFVIGSVYITGLISILFAVIELICAIFAFCVRGSIGKTQGHLLA